MIAGGRDGALAGMAEVEENVRLLDLRDGFAAEVGQAGVRGFEAAIAGEVALVVGELDYLDAERAEHCRFGRIHFQRRRVLEIVDEPDPPRRAGGREIGGAFDLEEQVGIFGDHPVPAGKRFHRAAEAVGAIADFGDGHADDVDPPLLERLDQLLRGLVAALAVRLEPGKPALGVDIEGGVLGRPRRRVLGPRHRRKAEKGAHRARRQKKLAPIHHALPSFRGA